VLSGCPRVVRTRFAVTGANLRCQDLTQRLATFAQSQDGQHQLAFDPFVAGEQIVGRAMRPCRALARAC
jgi:hypothetical protein